MSDLPILTEKPRVIGADGLVGMQECQTCGLNELAGGYCTTCGWERRPHRLLYYIPTDKKGTPRRDLGYREVAIRVGATRSLPRS